ncbi:ATP-dependent DNA helicase Q1 [Manduca sexta]|uniref:ATP-dependent DNA helicase n=1 Tax=Manduca sexta TaxID=7130 RepID=A0A921YXA5_MANSE|nr:ATP-dependent DNA helicase Q1 [Manduca sexta]KAG6447068.1 hypothetical protein O3G_MSEX004781 [Manduca sexta]
MTPAQELEEELKNVDTELGVVESEIVKLKSRQRMLHEKKNSLKHAINKLKSDKLAEVDWEGTNYTWSNDVKDILQIVFQLESFRPKQLSVINATLSGQHVIAVMPTGAGKSLCYQLPAMVQGGLTIVVSPLVSLIEDQVRSLTSKQIAVKYITSTTPKEQITEILHTISDKHCNMKLLYVTPERFAKSKRFMANLQKCYANGRLQRIAIDEVHCCSQWGHDFRPDYKYLGILSGMFQKTPILGLTATATAHVLSDVQKMLSIPGSLVIKSTFNRPNLYYKIIKKPTSQDECISIIENLLKHRYRGETGIIYTNSIKDSEDIAIELTKRGLKVGCYHANLDANDRTKVHTKWHEKKYQALAATVAFGMGIDKPDVRFVIHHTISKTMENYYQESGRAGRDGNHAECVTMYRMQDIFKVSSMVFSSIGNLDHLYGMVKYCLNGATCRRQLIAEHFDEDWGDTDCNKMCDICSDEQSEIEEIDLQWHCKTLVSIIEIAENQDTKLTANKLLDAWFLKGPVALRHKGKLPKLSREVAEDVLAFLLVENYLVEDFHFTSYTTISYIKKGPCMDSIHDTNFSLKMPIRKYTPLSQNNKKETSREMAHQVKSFKKRKTTFEAESEAKVSKIVVID